MGDLLLSERNPVVRDGDVTFWPEPHLYVYKGQHVRKSATGLVKQWFPEFDSRAIVDENFTHWKNSKTNKYSALIRYLQLVQGKDDDFCKSAIRDLWQVGGETASEEGTRMHADFEAIVNGHPPPQGETKEVVMFRQWLGHFQETYNVEPFRSELLLYYLHNDSVLVAGQVDLVMRNRTTGELWCVDYKRKDPSPKYPNGPLQILGEAKASRAFGKSGFGPYAKFPADDYYKYCAQQNVYGYIAAGQYGMDFRSRMFLLQVHPSLDRAELVAVDRWDEETEALFEHERREMEAEPSSPF